MAGSKTVFREGNVSVSLDSTLTDISRRAIDLVLPGVLEIMERETREIAEYAFDEWPVVTGLSRDGLEVVTTIDIGRGQVRVGVRNDVPYAIYIRPKRWHGAGTAWSRLVQVPMGKLQKELVKTLAPQILNIMRSSPSSLTVSSAL